MLVDEVRESKAWENDFFHTNITYTQTNGTTIMIIYYVDLRIGMTQ